MRGGFLIDPAGKIRAVQIYPREVGASGPEIRRLIAAIHKFDNENVYTPANWQPGDDVLLPKFESLDDVIDKKRRDIIDSDIYCPAWYMCFKKDKATTAQKTEVVLKRNTVPQRPLQNSTFRKPF